MQYRVKTMLFQISYVAQRRDMHNTCHQNVICEWLQNVNNRFETTIVDIVFSPTITESMLLYFSEFYEEHLNQFKHGLNQSLPIKQKQHFSIDSFPFSCSNGPPTYNSCFKYELRNAIFKKGAYNICNFKIIATSLAISNELSALSHSVNKSRSRDFC